MQGIDLFPVILN